MGRMGPMGLMGLMGRMIGRRLREMEVCAGRWWCESRGCEIPEVSRVP